MSNIEQNLEAYRQANEDLRNFSVMRLSVLGAFTAISGGLFAVVVDKPKDTHSTLLALCIFNVAVAGACASLEARINEVSEFYAYKIDRLAAELGMSDIACSAPTRAAFGKLRGSILSYVVFGGSSLMWICAWWSF